MFWKEHQSTNKIWGKCKDLRLKNKVIWYGIAEYYNTNLAM